MSAQPNSLQNIGYPHRHLLGTEGLSADEITFLLDVADTYVDLNRQEDKKKSLLSGRTVVDVQLGYLDVNAGHANGVETRAAIREFENQQGLPETGQPSVYLLGRLIPAAN